MFKTSILRSDLCDYSDAYIIVKGKITVTGKNNDNRVSKKLAFKNNAPFRSCIWKMNITFIENAEDLDMVMPMYNMLEYSDNYSMTSGSLWNYYRHEINDDKNENDTNENMINIIKITTSKSFKYKAKMIESMETYEKLIEMSRNDDYTTGNVLDFSYHQNYYKHIGINLSRHANTNIPQQINFVGKLEKDDDVVMFFIAEKQQNALLNFSLNWLIVSV